MALHQRSFKVSGSGEFPLDMLRYDTCWPYNGDDVVAMTPRYDTPGPGDVLEVRTVRLCKYAHTKRGPFVEAGRWASFGWTVIEEDVR